MKINIGDGEAMRASRIALVFDYGGNGYEVELLKDRTKPPSARLSDAETEDFARHLLAQARGEAA